jgi:hypothetical protein
MIRTALAAINSIAPTDTTPGNLAKDTLLTSFRNSGSAGNDTLMVRLEEKSVEEPKLKHGLSRSGRRTSIDPALKAWIDNVIVPALADQWVAQQDTRMVIG